MPTVPTRRRSPRPTPPSGPCPSSNRAILRILAKDPRPDRPQTARELFEEIRRAVEDLRIGYGEPFGLTPPTWEAFPTPERSRANGVPALLAPSTNTTTPSGKPPGSQADTLAIARAGISGPGGRLLDRAPTASIGPRTWDWPVKPVDGLSTAFLRSRKMGWDHDQRRGDCSAICCSLTAIRPSRVPDLLLRLSTLVDPLADQSTHLNGFESYWSRRLSARRRDGDRRAWTLARRRSAGRGRRGRVYARSRPTGSTSPSRFDAARPDRPGLDGWPRIITREGDSTKDGIRFLRIQGDKAPGSWGPGTELQRRRSGPMPRRTRSRSRSGYYLQETEVTHGQVEDYLHEGTTSEARPTDWDEDLHMA